MKDRLGKNDLVIGISGSGNSKNILKAGKYAKSQNVKTIGICGYNGGYLFEIADMCFCTNINDIQISEDIHMLLGHLVMRVLLSLLGNEMKY